MSKELIDSLDMIATEKATKILPENIKKDISILGVIGNLEAVNNQDKEITENGTYTADEGYTGLGAVTVNVPTSEDLQEQLNAQDAIIEELQTELENKARIGYNTKAEFGVLESNWNGQYQRYLTEIDADVAQQIADDCANYTNTSRENHMFKDCSSLKSVPLFDTSNMDTFNGMFLWCGELLEIPLFDTSNVTYMPAAFKGCSKLTEVPLFNTSKVINMNETFRLCESLTSIPLLDTSSVTIMSNIFYGCTNLINIPIFNTSNVKNMKYMVKDCPSLSDESLNNILMMCVNATNYTYTKTLADIGLTSEQATKCTTLSNYEAFTTAGWTTGY